MRSHRRRTKAFATAMLLTIVGTGLYHLPTISRLSLAKAQTEYLPAKEDFVGKWQLSGSAIRPPRDLKGSPTEEQEAIATEFQQTASALYGAFDYLEIKPDGRYNFHQPGDPESGPCVWCGTWSFKNDSLWLDLDTAPRLDIYAKGGDMQMTYTVDPDKTSQYKWLVLGWTRLD